MMRLEYPQELFSAVNLLSLQFLEDKSKQVLVFYSAGGVSGQMTHFVASSTLGSAISCVMQGAFCTQKKVSMVSFRRISPNRFLSSILLVVVIIITVVIVVVILVVAVVEVVIIVVVFGVVVVVDGVSLIF
ncbi:hypothetical protein Tco_0187077 [Tanacetum coccineum]